MVWHFIGVFLINMEIQNFSSCVEKYFTRSHGCAERQNFSSRVEKYFTRSHGRAEIQNFSSSVEKYFTSEHGRTEIQNFSSSALTREIFFNTRREILYLCAAM